MICPACGHTQATCVINNYWDCPAPGCKNYSGKESVKQAKDFFIPTTTWELLAGPASRKGLKGSNTLYTGSPWVVGQHKVAMSAQSYYVAGDIVGNLPLYDSRAEVTNPMHNASFYEVKLFKNDFNLPWGWYVSIVRGIP